ncbi:unnamed protein product [Pieris macdunnoughi]|uniref:DUF7027 domain-containing protein n=1 Tax=Pieris macdunnoughi TaxID=345717 RepID=A0A821R1K9_9NEOP|nr:unnamed protein product [Pieris macdunnoughi]
MCLPMSNCCCCISLSVGAKIVAILSLMTSTCTVLVYGTAALLPRPDTEIRRISYVVVAAAAVIKFIMACLMAYGAFQKKPKFLLPWLLTAWIYAVILLIASLFGSILIALKVAKNMETTSEVSTMVSAYFIYAIILYYFASVVNSRREEMLRDRQIKFTYISHRLMGQKVLPKMYTP